LDGTCKASGISGGFSFDQLRTVAAAIDLWLEAYREPTRKEGLPNRKIIDRIKELPLTVEEQARVRFAAFNAIDIALGFDFSHPRGNCHEYDERCLGIMRIPLDPLAVALLKGVQVAFARGLREHNSKSLAKPLMAFWKQYPKFRPHHSGRCYPHGHREYPYKSAIQCQVEELSRILDGLLAPHARLEKH
jgi:hypothetical protein